jgi:hypothetical protein
MVTAFLLVVAVVVVLTWSRSPYSIVQFGEEGFEPYDPRLSLNEYDPLKWVQSPVSCAGLAGTRLSNCQGLAAGQHGLSAKDGTLVQSAVPYVNVQPSVRTADLWLVDFRTEFQLFAGGADGGTVCWYGYCYTATGGREDRRSSSPTATFALRWDIAEIGKYQIFINNELVTEGIAPEGTPFYLSSTPVSDYGTQWWLRGEVRFKNPRVKRLFNCDLQAGEVKVHTCVAGPRSLTVNDLSGFKRFCPSLPATFTDAGIAGSSERVYYNLSAGQSLTLGVNQVWDFQYIADGKALNTPPDKTGLVELCKGPIIIDDLKDLPVENASIAGGTLTWSSYGRFDGIKGYRTKKTDLASGDGVFMKTSPVRIDEAACPYAAATQEYPGLPSSCFSVEAFGKTFQDGETRSINEYLNVTLQKLSVRYRDDETNGHVVSWSAQWRLSFGPLAVTIRMPTDDAALGSSYNAQYEIINGLPSPAFTVTSIQVYSTTIGEKTTVLSNASLGAQGSKNVMVTLPTRTLGEQRLTMTPSLQTEYGGITFQQISASYNVTSDAPARVELHWWSRLWEWIKNLFTY